MRNRIYIKLLVFFAFFLMPLQELFACTTCNRPLQASLFDAGFTKMFFLMLLPFILVWVVVARIYKLK